MYKAYNLIVPEKTLDQDFTKVPTKLTDDSRVRVRKNIKDFFDNETIDATALEQEWFGPTQPHIFLSHSHKDAALAAVLAEMFSKFLGISCFIDSFVWGYADDLLDQIDHNFCKSESGSTFDYAKRNRSTSHVHTMLSAALAKMMDRAECVIFLNTPNSIVTKDFIAGGEATTASPWIYNELLLTRLLPSKVPERALNEGLYKSEAIAREQFPTFEFTVAMDHLTDLAMSDIETWLDCGRKGTDALDVLYQTHR